VTEWLLSSGHDPRALAIVDGLGPFTGHGPHYSRRTPGARSFTGCGAEVVLLHASTRAVWAVVYQKTPQPRGSGASRDRVGLTGTRARFRLPEHALSQPRGGLSSELIASATEETYAHWIAKYGALPPERLRTEIGMREVRSSNPGYCYKVAGWTVDRVVRGKLYLWAPERAATLSVAA
jgi:hypothetical protein